ncbi:MAG: hypothetical protein ACREN8_12830 [Candidatus Dormibacteraceae bacterium]
MALSTLPFKDSGLECGIRWLNSAGAYSLLAAETLETNLPTHAPSQTEQQQMAAVASRHFKRLWENHPELGVGCLSRYLERAMIQPLTTDLATSEVNLDSSLEIVEDLRAGIWGEFDRATGRIRVARPLIPQLEFSATVAALANLKYKHLAARLAQTKPLHTVSGELRIHVRELTRANLSGQTLTANSDLEHYTSKLTATVFASCRGYIESVIVA